MLEPPVFKMDGYWISSRLTCNPMELIIVHMRWVAGATP